MASKSPNVRHLRINGPVHALTPEGADRAGQLWSRVEELDLKGSRFDLKVLGSFTRHFPHLKSLKIDNIYYGKVALFDSIFSNHPNLVDFECRFGDYMQDANWFRSCDVPLEKFVVKRVMDESTTMDTLENCCKDSLRSIAFLSVFERDSQTAKRIFSNFQQLREVSLYLLSFSYFQNYPVLPYLEKLSLYQLSDGGEPRILIDFLKSYPQLEELHLKNSKTNLEFAKNILATLPNLKSLSLQFAKLNSTVWKSLTALKKLEQFNFGVANNLVVEDVQAFVRETPSLQRLTFWIVNGGSTGSYLNFYKAIRDEIRSSGSNRQLWVGQDGGLYFLLDSSETCTDIAIEEFVKELMEKKSYPWIIS